MNRLPANLPELLKDAGLHVVEVAGWENRGRPASKGPFHPVGVLWHHTGDKNGGLNYARWLAEVGRSDLPAPLCHLSIGRDGTVYVVAAGRANHAGVAKPSGSVAGGDGNALYVGVECQNTGSEGWSKPQHAAMVTTGVVLGRLLGCSSSAQRGHKETSVTGKWDPGKLDMDTFRGQIAAASKPTTVPAHPVVPAKKAPVKNHVTAGRTKIREHLKGVDEGIAELAKAPASRDRVHDEVKAHKDAQAAHRAALKNGVSK